jgi:probable addiction module antidote protein
MFDKKADAKCFRDNPEAIAAYLSEAFEKNDVDIILSAINRVMRAQNVQALAREAGLRRDKLYVSFNGGTEPYLYRVMALFNALGVRLTVKAAPPRPIPPRPKLGRPRKRPAN